MMMMRYRRGVDKTSLVLTYRTNKRHPDQANNLIISTACTCLTDKPF